MTCARARRLAVSFTALTVATVTAGCSSATSPPSSTPTTSGTASASPSPAPKAMDAKAVLDKLTVTGLPIRNGLVQDENTDPNNLLGRPNGYTSRASFDVPGGDTQAQVGAIDRGGAIEVWPDTPSAKARADYIQTTLKNTRLGTEYHYLSGPYLVRITGNVKPSAAKQFESAVATI